MPVDSLLANRVIIKLVKLIATSTVDFVYFLNFCPLARIQELLPLITKVLAVTGHYLHRD